MLYNSMDQQDSKYPLRSSSKIYQKLYYSLLPLISNVLGWRSQSNLFTISTIFDCPRSRTPLVIMESMLY